MTEAAHLGDERTTLLGFLQRQRDLVAWKMSDASDETLASVRMPSGLTLHGIVRHLENVDARGSATSSPASRTCASTTARRIRMGTSAEGIPIADLLASYAAETALCDGVIAAAPSLDATATDGTYCCVGSSCTSSRKPGDTSATSTCFASGPTAPSARNLRLQPDARSPKTTGRSCVGHPPET